MKVYLRIQRLTTALSGIDDGNGMAPAVPSAQVTALPFIFERDMDRLLSGASLVATGIAGESADFPGDQRLDGIMFAQGTDRVPVTLVESSIYARLIGGVCARPVEIGSSYFASMPFDVVPGATPELFPLSVTAWRPNGSLIIDTRNYDANPALVRHLTDDTLEQKGSAGILRVHRYLASSAKTADSSIITAGSQLGLIHPNLEPKFTGLDLFLANRSLTQESTPSPDLPYGVAYALEILEEYVVDIPYDTANEKALAKDVVCGIGAMVRMWGTGSVQGQQYTKIHPSGNVEQALSLAFPLSQLLKRKVISKSENVVKQHLSWIRESTSATWPGIYDNDPNVIMSKSMGIGCDIEVSASLTPFDGIGLKSPRFINFNGDYCYPTGYLNGGFQ